MLINVGFKSIQFYTLLQTYILSFRVLSYYRAKLDPAERNYFTLLRSTSRWWAMIKKSS